MRQGTWFSGYPAKSRRYIHENCRCAVISVDFHRELDHPNLCKFIGGCIEVPNVAIVTEYCPKGSLSDVLFNEDIPLNWGFRYKNTSEKLHETNCAMCSLGQDVYFR